jgi:uncharacterized lipoprotein YbaY
MVKTRIVRGEIVLPGAGVPAQSGTIIVYVEDVFRADKPSAVIAAKRQSNVLLRPGLRVPFAVKIPDQLLDESRSYSVRVHIDTSGSGDVTVGDFVSAETYPVSTRGGNTVQISVGRV